MNPNNGQFDIWLDRAFAEYSAAEPPLGFESRVLASLRTARPRRKWLPLLAMPALAASIWAIVVIRTPLPHAPALLQANITAPKIQKLELAPHVASDRHIPVQRTQSTRGVPIVVPPVTPEEEAILRVVRNSRAKQLAGVMMRPRDLSEEAEQLEIKELDIAPILGERKR